MQEAFVPVEVRRGNRDEPVAIRSCLGWSVLGGSFTQGTSEPANLNYIRKEDVTLNEQLEEFWKVESYGSQTEPT